MNLHLQDSKDRFGWFTILFHWVTTLAIFGLFALGLYMVELNYYDALYKTLPHIHKSVAVLIAILLIVGLIWKPFQTRPDAIVTHSRFVRIGSSIAHWSLYTLIGATSIAGYLISTAEGASISVFDWFSVPASVTSIPEQEDLTGKVHKYLAYALVGIGSLHGIMALKHHFIDRDSTLRRMIGLKS